MKTLKTIIPICLICISLAGYTQQQTVSTAFNAALEKILLEFPNAFSNLMGEEILKDDTEVRYESRIILPGAEDCIINASTDGTVKSVGWEAVFASTETYEEAEKIYKQLYLQLISCRFKLKTKSSVSLVGKWKSPVQDENYSTTLLTLSSATGNYRKMAIELEMVKVLDEWKVNLRVKENA